LIGQGFRAVGAVRGHRGASRGSPFWDAAVKVLGGLAAARSALGNNTELQRARSACGQSSWCGFRKYVRCDVRREDFKASLIAFESAVIIQQAG